VPVAFPDATPLHLPAPADMGDEGAAPAGDGAAGASTDMVAADRRRARKKWDQRLQG